MFFKEDKNPNNEATNGAYYITFLYWGVILLINFYFEQYKGREFISSSGTILFSGIAILYISEFILKKSLNK